MIDILRQEVEAWREGHVPTRAQLKLLCDILVCRTEALGGHLHVCPNCDYEVPLYNPCGNRNCPNCQALAQAHWIEAREEVILPIGHHHAVFTLPSELRPLARRLPVTVFNLLFTSVRKTLNILARQVLHGQVGITAVLHTWTRDLLFHPHVHCIITAGALCKDGQTFLERPRFLFSVERMKAIFRGRILAGLDRLRRQGLISSGEQTALLLSLPNQKKWVVYLERPFGRSSHLIAYLGRYTHRIAISDARLVSFDGETVSFVTKDDKVVSLPAITFVERFMQHVLPHGFHKIRHFGLYAPGSAKRLEQARRLLDDSHGESTKNQAEPTPAREPWDVLLERLTGKDPLLCPRCKKARMQRFPLPDTNHATGPPARSGC